MFPADCHCHSTYSDGVLTPQGLVTLAIEKQLKGFAITDHDCIQAYLDNIHEFCRDQLKMISGVEMSSVFEGTPIHVLGYSFAIQNQALQSICETQQNSKHNRNLKIIDKLNKQGIPIDYEKCQAAFPAQQNIGRPHIAQYLVEQGWVRHAREAFKKYLGNEAICYVKGDLLDTATAIQLIQQAGGLAILAHPHMLKKPKVFKKLLDLPFDGIEAFYGRLPMNQHQPWLQAARERDWLTTGGSDYHGHEGEYKNLGDSTTPAEVFAELYDRFLLNNPDNTGLTVSS